MDLLQLWIGLWRATRVQLARTLALLGRQRRALRRKWFVYVGTLYVPPQRGVRDVAGREGARARAWSWRTDCAESLWGTLRAVDPVVVFALVFLCVALCAVEAAYVLFWATACVFFSAITLAPLVLPALAPRVCVAVFLPAALLVSHVPEDTWPHSVREVAYLTSIKPPRYPW